MKIIGVTVGTPLPKPNFDQTDPKKGDYIKGDRSFLNAIKTINGVGPDSNGDFVIAVDDTLTQAGVAADAKIVGESIEVARIRAEIALLAPNLEIGPDVEIYYDPDKTEIVANEFANNADIEVAYFPNVVTAGNYSFNKCINLKAAILPKLEMAMPSMFRDCTKLEQVVCPSVTYIRGSAFQGCTSLREAVFPEAVTVQQGDEFKDCTKLEKVSFPKLTTLKCTAFYNCTSLTTVDLPALEDLDFAFQRCTALKTVILPSLKTIGGNSLRDSGINALVLSDNAVVTLSREFRSGTDPITSGTGYIYVPAALIEDYKVAPLWSTYAAQFRALEDFTVDGTTTGELDDFKVKMAAAIDPTLIIAGAPADAKAVGDLWRAYPDDDDVLGLLTAIGLYQQIADAEGNVLTDETGAILLI